MRKWGASFIKRAVGYDFTTPDLSTNFPRVLERMRSFSPEINTVIDVGASDGSWSQSVKPAWPRARYLLVEAQDRYAAPLQAYAGANPEVMVENAAASDRTGSLYFLDAGPLTGSASHEPFAERSIEIPCISIDDSISRHGLPGPFLIKLDTHGHEREILTGASATLSDAKLICIEAYSFANFGRMRFWELCTFLEERGFRPAGMSDVMCRPSDNLLWQMDLWFLPASHPAFTDTNFNSTA